MYGPQQDDDKKKALQLQAQAEQPVYGPRNPPPGELLARPKPSENDPSQPGIGPQGREAPSVSQGGAVTPLAGPRGYGVPSAATVSVAAGARGPRGAGAIIGPVRAPLSATEAGKAKQWAGGVSDRASGAAVAAVKASPDNLPPTASGNEASPAAPSAPVGQQAGRGAYLKTGIGQGAAGGEIVGRVGADGVPEFTNDAKAVAGAQAMPKGGFGYPGRATATPGNMTAPAGARVLASGTNVPAGDAELARTGSAANVGNGIGTFSVMGEEGDAQRAIATFERANQIRGGVPRQRELGDNGGKVTVVRDSARAPTITELVNERRDLQLRGADRADRLADSRIATDGRATDRADQKQAQDMAKGDVELAAAESALATSQELDAIRQKLADPNLGEEERRALVDTYYTMTTAAKDRYMVVEGGTGEFGEKQASRVLDRQTRQYVDSGGTGIANDPEAAAIRDNPKLSREEKVAQLKALGYN